MMVKSVGGKTFAYFGPEIILVLLLKLANFLPFVWLSPSNMRIRET